MRYTWERTSIRVTDLMVTPDFTRLVAVGMYDSPAATAANPQDAAAPQGGAGAVPGANTGASANKSSSETRIIIYDLSTKQPESCVPVSFASAARGPPRAALGVGQDGDADAPAPDTQVDPAGRRAHEREDFARLAVRAHQPCV